MARSRWTTPSGLPVLLVIAAAASGCVNLTLPKEITQARDAPPFSIDPDRSRPEPAGGDAGQPITAPLPPDREQVPTDAAPDAQGDPTDGGTSRVANGKPCAEGSQCTSGVCVDGVCCNNACTGPCLACNVEGTAGTCMAVLAGQDPGNDCSEDPLAGCQHDGACDGKGGCRLYPAGVECQGGRCEGATEYGARTCDGKGVCQAGSSKSCAPNICTGNSCASRCTQPGDCQTGFFCAAGTCKAKLARGAACTAASQCSSGNCADGVCCDLPCNQGCYACNIAGGVGTCKAAPDGQDPRAECPAQAPSTCGRRGGCNGQGACRLYAANVICAAATCSDGSQTTARLCNGLGTCGGTTRRDCGVFACEGTACATRCTTAAQCRSGLECTAGNCTMPVSLPPPPGPVPTPMPARGPVLYWKLDEADGARALDASGNDRHGSYVGTTGAPTASTMVPMLMFANPRSREFLRSDGQYIRLAAMPAALKPTAEITIALWYRSTSIDNSDTGSRAASELVSGGSAYILRLLDTDIELLKRVQEAGGISYARCYGPAGNPLDGNWHHVAGISSAAGLKVYIDGVEKCSNTRGEPVAYDANVKDLWVGRYRDPEGGYLFQGNMDEVRIYDRALTAAEVAGLAAGGN